MDELDYSKEYSEILSREKERGMISELSISHDVSHESLTSSEKIVQKYLDRDRMRDNEPISSDDTVKQVFPTDR